MKLTVLGAGTVLPATGRSPSGYLVEFGGRQILFDIGAGTLARLDAAGHSYRDLDVVAISHLHADHVLDLIALLQANNATPGWTRTARLHLIGCRGLAAFVDSIVALFDGAAPENYAIEVRELDPGRHYLPGIVVEAALTRHTANSLAFRLEAEGKSLVYSGDAVETAELANLARGADVFVCECSFPRGVVTADHLTADAAARLAATANVRRLVLTHTYPSTDAPTVAGQAAEIYRGEIAVAVDGARFEV
jgi:ribonuclease BN (tRNA processing enzyme)